MKKNAVFLSALVTAVLAVTGCDNGAGYSGGGEPFPIEGVYSLSVNDRPCKLEFASGGKYEFTGYVSSMKKSGTWSASGNIITMSMVAQGSSMTVAISEGFTARKSGNTVTLSLRDSSAEVSLILSSFALAGKEVVLTKEGSDGGPGLIIGRDRIAGHYRSDSGVIEFKPDGTVGQAGRVTSLDFSGTWSLDNGNELTITAGGDEEKKETFVIKSFESGEITLALKDKSEPSGLQGVGLDGRDSDQRIARVSGGWLQYCYFLGEYATDINDYQSTLKLDDTGYYTFKSGGKTYTNQWNGVRETGKIIMKHPEAPGGNYANEETFVFARDGAGFVLALEGDQAEKSLVLENFGADAKTLTLVRKAEYGED